jgi:hypothetical protein
MPTDQLIQKRRDRYAMAAFCQAMVVLVWPVQSTMLALAPQAGGAPLVIAVITMCTGPVIFLFGKSVLRHWREPGNWSGRGYLIGTAMILGVNFVAYTAGAINYFFYMRE